MRGWPKKESMEFVIHMYSKEMVIHRSVFTLQRYEIHYRDTITNKHIVMFSKKKAEAQMTITTTTDGDSLHGLFFWATLHMYNRPTECVIIKRKFSDRYLFLFSSSLPVFCAYNIARWSDLYMYTRSNL